MRALIKIHIYLRVLCIYIFSIYSIFVIACFYVCLYKIGRDLI